MASLLILIPLLGIVVLNLPVRNIMTRFAFGFALAIFALQILLAVYQQPVFLHKEILSIDSFFGFTFSLDQLSFIMLLCIGIVSIASLLVTRHTILDDKERFKFINLLILASIGMSGIVIVKDIFSLYVFLEITAISSFILIAFEKDVYALEGSFKYLMLSAIATIMMLSAIAVFFLISGGTSFESIRSAIRSSDNNLVNIAVGLFVCGMMIKGGVAPFHAWVPDAYTSAPAAASVLLAGIVTKAAGIYTLIRLFASVFGLDPAFRTLLMILGTISILVGAFAAMGQTNMKRLLAYSSVSQVGYILLGFGTGTFMGVAGAVFHMFNHSIFKALLFVNSAAVESRAGTTDMEKMGGLSSRMPITGVTSVIGMLSAAGVPPMSGFWSKLMIITALWLAGSHIYSAIALAASVLTLSYLLTMQRKAFFGKLAKGLEDITEARSGISIASVMLAVILVGAGVSFPYIYNGFLVQLKELLIKI